MGRVLPSAQLAVFAARSSLSIGRSRPYDMVNTLLNHVRKPNPILERLSANAFGIYLVHCALVLWIQYALLPVPWPAWTKFGVAFMGGLALSWGLTALARQYAKSFRRDQYGIVYRFLSKGKHPIRRRGISLKKARGKKLTRSHKYAKVLKVVAILFVIAALAAYVGAFTSTSILQLSSKTTTLSHTDVLP